jgi:membrane associated rhomboid family serine protease
VIPALRRHSGAPLPAGQRRADPGGQALVTLLAGTAAQAHVPQLGASGAIAAGLGAYFVLYPRSRVLTLVIVFPVRVPAWLFLGGWFLFQLVEGDFGLFSPSSGGGAFFAHVCGFLFGVCAARLLSLQPQPALQRLAT